MPLDPPSRIQVLARLEAAAGEAKSGLAAMRPIGFPCLCAFAAHWLVARVVEWQTRGS